ncbi:uncharacterized protein [Amphiura filiformis]|uniref:uncharacterized protein n=1 Tax=Amphiura filiformis TaxID=82378 RepID=UPI003B2253BC
MLMERKLLLVLSLCVACFILCVMFMDSYYGYMHSYHGYVKRPKAPVPTNNNSVRFDKLRELKLNWSSVVPNVSTNQLDHQCNLQRFGPSTKPDKDVKCKRLKPLKDSCKIATELFFSEPTETCSHQKTYNICAVIKDANGTPSVTCSPSMCNSSIGLGVIDWNHGIVEWNKIHNATNLEAQIQSLVEQPPENPNFGFCFIKCIVVEREKVVIGKKEEENYVQKNATQLLLLPPQIATSNLSSSKTQNGVNINWIWLDSVSHSHFMRSMPATIKSLKNIQRQESGYVFSYNLYQSLYSHSTPNQRALFTGEVSKRGSKGGIKSELLLGRYKTGGYETYYSDDLCWKHTWGLAKYLGAGANWKKIKDALPKAGIDRIDMTLSSCEVLGGRFYYNINKAICYNGKYQEFYILSYLAELQKQLQKRGKPYFHYMETSVAHEGTGRRVQTFDEDLANYFRSLSTQENTLTVLFADHGNNYGRLFSKTSEAKVETHHPMLIIHASKNMPHVIGVDKMKALLLNQDRLVSILDLHYALHTLAPGGSINVATEHAQYNVQRMGLLAPIDVNRTCDSIPMVQPNLCICENYNTKYVVNDTRQTIVAEFALGEINNVIQSQFRAAHRDAATGFGSCQRLLATWFGNVRETTQTDAVTTQLDIHVPGGKNASQDEDSFSVTRTLYPKPTR